MTGPFAPRVVVDCGASFVRPGLCGPHGSSGLPRVGLKVKDRHRRVCRQICAEWASSNVPTEESTDRRRFLLKYVQELEPEIMERFADIAPAQVVDAFRQSVTTLIGTLPPQYFDVTIATELMYSVAMSGYMMRNAQYRLDLSNSLDRRWVSGFTPVGLGPYSRSWDEGCQYAEGSQLRNVQGDVLRWHHDKGLETIPAAEYIASLEQEVAWLRQQMGKSLAGGQNALLDYLKSLDASAIQELTACNDDVLEAINSFIQRMLENVDGEEWGAQPTAFPATQVSRMLFFLMVVGYLLRTLEVRFDMEALMMLPEQDPSPASLPP